MTNDDPGHAFEIEAATVDEFLRLLKEREGNEAALVARRGPLRSAVFVARTLEERSSRFGYPKVTRHVVAAFARGSDLVCCRRTTSSAVELPEIADTTEGRQLAAYEGMRAEIARGLKEAGLGVPLYEGCLRRVVEPDKS